METRNSSISIPIRTIASACLLTVGLAVFGFGMTRVLVAQNTGIATCSSRHSGNECTSGEFCLLGFCWSWTTYWPTDEEVETCPYDSPAACISIGGHLE